MPRKSRPSKPAACPCHHKTFGCRIENDTLIRETNAATGMLRSPRGWALLVQIVNQHQGEVHWILFRDTATGRTWKSSVENFLRHGIEFNRGFGDQIVLPERFWIHGPEPVVAETAAPPQPAKEEAAGTQLKLL